MYGRGQAAGIVGGLAGAATFALSGPMVKPLLAAGWTPGAAITVRLGMGAVLLAVPTVRGWRGRGPLLRRHAWLLALFGTVGVGGGSAFFYLAVQRLPVAVALLVEYTGPLLLIAWAWWRHGRAPSPGVVLGATLATAGLVGVLGVSGRVELDPLGLLYAALAAVSLAVYFGVAAVELPLPPVAAVGTGLAVGGVFLALLLAVGVLPARVAGGAVTLAGARVSWLVPVLVLGLLPTALAYALSAVSVRVLGDRVASFVALAEVLFATLWAWLLIGERPGAWQLVGAVGVVAGVALVRRFSIESAGPSDDPASATESVPLTVGSAQPSPSR